MERRVEQMGVPMVVAIAAAIIVLYSFWGAMLLRAEHTATLGGSTVVSNH